MLFFEDINFFFGNLIDEDYVKKRSCLSVASSSLLVIKSLTGQRNSVVEKDNIIFAIEKYIYCFILSFV